MTARVVDERGRPLDGLWVAAPGDEADRLVGWTGPDGGLRLADAASPVRPPLLLYDRLGLREVAPLPEGGEERVVPRALAEGWVVMQGRPAPPALSAGNRVEALPDAEMHAAVRRAVRRASRTLHLSQLLWEPGFVGVFDDGARPLLDDVLDAARRGVRVRLLLNENALLPDTVEDTQRRLRDARRAEVRAFALAPNLFHAKVLVVDGEEAMVLGPPFQQKYWDTARHLPRDPRRGPADPFHDVSLRLRGPAVRDVDEFFVAMWNARRPDGEPPLEPCDAPPPEGMQTVQVAMTVPRDVCPSFEQGARGILEAYLRALASARRLFYAENQYFTSETVTRAIRRALDRRDGLEVILLLNESTDVPGYTAWQRRRVEELRQGDASRLGVFTLARPDPLGQRLRPVYVHSKVAIADDAWATLGTANLDSASLEESREFLVPMESNVDVNAIVLDGIEGAPRTGWVGAFRRRLWAEHLGDEGVWRATPREGGWLGVWRRAAEANARRLERGEPMVGRVLPYRPEGLPEV